MLQFDAITEDMHRNGWPYIDFKNHFNSDEITKFFDFFFYINGRFPVHENLIIVPVLQ